MSCPLLTDTTHCAWKEERGGEEQHRGNLTERINGVLETERENNNGGAWDYHHGYSAANGIDVKHDANGRVGAIWREREARGWGYFGL